MISGLNGFEKPGRAEKPEDAPGSARTERSSRKQLTEQFLRAPQAFVCQHQ